MFGSSDSLRLSFLADRFLSSVFAWELQGGVGECWFGRSGFEFLPGLFVLPFDVILCHSWL